MTEPENTDFHFPITPIGSVFIELSEELNNALNAGFTRDEAFTLVRILFRSRVAAALFSPDNDDDEDDDDE